MGCFRRGPVDLRQQLARERAHCPLRDGVQNRARIFRGEGAGGQRKVLLEECQSGVQALSVKKEEAAEVLLIEGREVRVTHPGKLYFSKQTKVSKLDLVRYYLSVAPGALAGIRNRPIVLKRFVNGAEGEAFYQKRAPTERPPWLRTVTLSFPSGRTAEEVVVDDAAGLAWI